MITKILISALEELHDRLIITRDEGIVSDVSDIIIDLKSIIKELDKPFDRNPPAPLTAEDIPF